MDRATRSKIEEWESRPISGGYAGLSELASAEFTGAVAAGGAHLFMLNGKVVGVVDGTMSAFETGEATAYPAPDPALPLLFAMRERNGEVQGQYYTDDTPLQEVDQTLSEGGFTGFLELSENVLSGDYYVVYYGGRSLSAAFVGNEERVVTGSEAFDLAADEVGIYEVRSVDLEVVDVPEPTAEQTAAAAAESDESDATDAEPAPDQAPTEEEPEPADDAAADDESAEGTGSTAEAPADEPATTDGVPDDDAAAETSAHDAEASDSEPADAAPSVDSDPIPDADADSDTAAVDSGHEDTEAAAEPNQSAKAADTDPQPAETNTGPDGSAGKPRAEPSAEQSEERFKEEERWRESRTVPALDPEESELPGEPAPSPEPSPAQPTQPATEPPETETDEHSDLHERIDELEAALESTEEERRRQAERVEELVEERNELQTERDALEERIDELEAKIEEQAAATPTGSVQAEPSSQDSGSAATQSVDAATALDQTDLFVRYDSKGQATLQTAHDGRANREEVAENLRIEMHSRFDADETTVDGRPFQDYLEDTIEYRFVAWLIEDLLYEIQDTGSERALRLLYDALPQVDRAEFAGTITATDEEGEERSITFDVICRDRMGKPLIVANINDSLDPATGEMMAGLIEDATAAGEGHEAIGAAFLVTASFFQPDALETASGATGGGFLSRDSKKSFVKLARKGGYHLCLAEARGGDFHVAVPDF